MNEDYRIDLTQHNDEELIDWVINDKYLYNLRRDVPNLLSIIHEQFLYTGSQMSELIDYLEHDY